MYTTGLKCIWRSIEADTRNKKPQRNRHTIAWISSLKYISVSNLGLRKVYITGVHWAWLGNFHCGQPPHRRPRSCSYASGSLNIRLNTHCILRSLQYGTLDLHLLIDMLRGLQLTAYRSF